MLTCKTRIWVLVSMIISLYHLFFLPCCFVSPLCMYVIYLRMWEAEFRMPVFTNDSQIAILQTFTLTQLTKCFNIHLTKMFIFWDSERLMRCSETHISWPGTWVLFFYLQICWVSTSRLSAKHILQFHFLLGFLHGGGMK
jgi:hypothetical protein